MKQSFEPIEDDKLATAQVLVNALNIVELKNIIGDALAFINIDQSLLHDEMLLSIPKEQFVLEILETVVVDEATLNRVKELKDLGYRFALDDADCSKEYVVNFQPLFQYIDFLKLDISTLHESELTKFLTLFEKFNLKILAEKVETQEQFDKYKKIGCHLFQGFFFAKPDIIENKCLDPEQLLILNIIRQLKDDYSLENILHMFEQNVALTLQLLRFINSAAFSFRSSIKSIRQAITLLGPNQLRSWLLLISYANPIKGTKTTANPLFELAQTRANMMQTLCKATYPHHCDKNTSELAAFIGLLSLVETLFQTPIDVILHELNVDQDIIDILILQKGDLGLIYQLVCAVELFDTEKIDTLIETLDLSYRDFSSAVQEAYAITEKFTSSLMQ
jgi:EAL and modified HD-GYP domain-containing signal transduction protein